MIKTVVAYFSAQGTTKKVAMNLAKAIEADSFEIEPMEAYTRQDLNWNDRKSRSSLEMTDPSSRPPIKETLDASQYDTIFLGFPIWWHRHPAIIDTFLESTDFTNKKIVVFATSGGSGLGKTVSIMKKVCPNATILEGKVLNPKASMKQLASWAKQF